MNENDVRVFAIKKVAEKLEQILYKYNVSDRNINEIDRYSWQQYALQAQQLIDAYNDAITEMSEK